MNSGPSRTSQVVALTRAGLDRPASRLGDPDAQARLCADLTVTPPAWLRPSIEARTRFVDEHVLAAIAAGTGQVVICGAGLDDRALRFRTHGVRFFELDHPVTQADKARRLRAMGVGADGPVLVPCDFQDESVAAALAAAGHHPAQPTLFVCEGLLVYLDLAACERLLAETAACAAPGSTLAVTLATYASQRPAAEVIAEANARRRTAAAEPWRTLLPAEEHLGMLTTAGWTVTATADSPTAADVVTDDRRSILVTARPAAGPRATR
jgi:methyltransferase (TIGR00027 family)